ncbi:unannotated protein [freshwater metagenome]|uniref:Unannotated protein n=1 Tax=freshwater metagenome TaxID=449393 RepID=A0A6J7MY42_9ZZZZ|nr:ROK family protein [Actinomycetota bacterium]
MSLFTSPAVPALLREMNERKVLDTLRAQGALHAAEIARINGLSKPTTSVILRSLVDFGLVQEYFPGADDPKRARSVFEAIQDIHVALAIDIGARFIRAGVSDLHGNVRSQVSIEVNKLDLKSILKTMHDAADKALKEAGFSIKKVNALVVGAPGVVDQITGEIAIAGTITDLDGVKLANLVAKEFGISPLVENDINLVTLAEKVKGHGIGVDNFAVLSVGSGLGAGLVLNGNLVRGHRGAAGEVFYVPFGDPSDTHRSSTNPSGDRISEMASALASKFPQSTLQAPYTTIRILDAARKGDALANEVVKQEAQRIALYVATISSVVDVEVVVLAGGIGRQADFFLQPVRDFVSAIVPFSPRIEVSTLGESSVLLGGLDLATSIACDRVFADRAAGHHRARAISESI